MNSLRQYSKISFVCIILVLSLSSIAKTQETFKVMTYNLLNYSTDTTRNQYYRTVIRNSNPDILVVEEILSQNGVNTFLNNVMNVDGNNYTAGTFIDGPDTDNAIFFKQSKFTFISNTPIKTDLRDISEFKILFTLRPADTINIYAVHLKSSTGVSNENQRALEIDSLRKVTNALPLGSLYIFLGDCNFYRSSEPAYIKLLAVNPDNKGHLIDPITTMSGIWNNIIYAPYHTQSTRVRQFGGGANGGLDDRFDLILFSPAMNTNGNIRYVPGSLTPFGNDGMHYKDSLNKRPNAVVSDSVADAIHYASDHIPVYAFFQITPPAPVELAGFSHSISGRTVNLNWSTIQEINNAGFFVQRRSAESNYWSSVTYITSSGNSNVLTKYNYSDRNLETGKYYYRIKQSDLNGNEHIYDLGQDVNIGYPEKYSLFQNYPNPFNPETNINYSLPDQSKVVITILDINGKTVATLLNTIKSAGFHSIRFNASGLSSGTYFYRIDAASGSHEYHQTMKMTLVK
ncbi:hypothetical protein BH10BAC5_BH10BAC5_21670 [soil metagenome]